MTKKERFLSVSQKSVILKEATDLMDKEDLTEKEYTEMDKKLRTGILTDIHPFWVRWGYISWKNRWGRDKDRR